MPTQRPRLPWTVYLWPGLSQLTQWGSWRALFWALFTAFLGDVAIITTYIWPETFAPGWSQVLCGAFAGVYFIGCFLTWQMEMMRRNNVHFQNDEDLFLDAQTYYLQGLYYESELKLHELLRRQEDDVPARILLADMYKNTGKYAKSLEQVQFLLNEPAAAAWRWEVFALEDRLKELMAEGAVEDTTIPFVATEELGRQAA